MAGSFQDTQRHENREPQMKVILTNSNQLPNHIEDISSYLFYLIIS